MIQDFGSPSVAEWTTLREGSYQLEATVLDPTTNAKAVKLVPFQFTSRVTGGVPVISPTQHPLVFLYSTPPCSAGRVQVKFGTGHGAPVQSTPSLPCNGSASVNFYLAGLQASTTYYARYQIVLNGTITFGPMLSFLTGAPAPGFPSFTVVSPPDAKTDAAQSVLLNSFGSLANSPGPTANDIAGNLIWYYQFPAGSWPSGTYLSRPVPGGNMTLIVGTAVYGSQILQEIDLAGNQVRQTNVWAINQQLANVGLTDRVSWLSHEGLRLPNGHTLTLGSVERLLTGVQGPGTVDVLGDMILDLDSNLQIAWIWNTFDFLDPSQPAILGETCSTDQICGGPLYLASNANDWTHLSSLNLLPDGNLLVAVRNQDSVLKIDYRNGTGDGHIIWTLGKQGNFSLIADPGDLWPWFSHPHDASFDGVNYTLLDNGNTRVAPPPTGLGYGNSRGQVLSLDESAFTALLLLNFDLGWYSSSFGSAQLLSNGNYQFLSGQVKSPEAVSSYTVETLPDGTGNFTVTWGHGMFRTFRMTSLYAE